MQPASGNFIELQWHSVCMCTFNLPNFVSVTEYDVGGGGATGGRGGGGRVQGGMQYEEEESEGEGSESEESESDDNRQQAHTGYVRRYDVLCTCIYRQGRLCNALPFSCFPSLQTV